MKKAFRDKLGLGVNNIVKLETVNKIIEEFKAQGYRLTLRQLYYQLVARGIIPNKQSEYAKLSTLLVKGRMGGAVDWNAIEDRLRVPKIPYYVSDVADALKDTINQYRLDRQETQDVYIELWVEKDALSSVLLPVTSEYHINLMVNRGYSSCSAMHDAYTRFKLYGDKKKKVILYLGDHDPSGLDMIRDIKERMREFFIETLQNEWYDKTYDERESEMADLEDLYLLHAETGNDFIIKHDGKESIDYAKMYAYKRFDEIFEIRHIGITKTQIDLYNPPPNPAKIKDPRADWYIAKHGNISWEVDALNPDILHKLIRKHVEKLIDIDKYNEVIKQEEQDKTKLQKFIDENIN